MFIARQRVADVAAILSRGLSTETKAAILSALVCIDADPRVSARDAAWLERLFDHLAALNPEAAAVAVA